MIDAICLKNNKYLYAKMHIYLFYLCTRAYVHSIIIHTLYETASTTPITFTSELNKFYCPIHIYFSHLLLSCGRDMHTSVVLDTFVYFQTTK